MFACYFTCTLDRLHCSSMRMSSMWHIEMILQ